MLDDGTGPGGATGFSPYAWVGKESRRICGAAPSIAAMPRSPSALHDPIRRNLSRDARELRDDLPSVRLQRLLLTVGHEVDVELVDADRLQLAQLRHRLLGIAEHAEAVADLV